MVIGYQPIFREDFGPWLLNNWSIWKFFERRANRLWDVGVRRAGARTIGETFRYITMLREPGGGHKVNDHRWPDCARLWMVLNPKRRGFFEIRDNVRTRKRRDQLELFEP